MPSGESDAVEKPSGPLGASGMDLAALALAIACALAARWVAANVFEDLPHLEDEFANLWQAKVFAQGSISLATPPEPQSFLVPFVVDYDGVRFGKYPPGWPAALALASKLDAEGWVNPVLAGLCVWLVYRLGSRLVGPGAALLGAFLAATSPAMLMLAGSLMSHVFSLFLTLSLAQAWYALFARGAPQPRPVWLLVALAGASLGLLVLTRPLTALGVALPFAIHGLFLWARGGPARWRPALVGLVAVAVGLLFPLWNAAQMGDPIANAYSLWWDYDRIGFGPGIGRIAGGHSPQLAFYNARFSLRAGQHDLFGWPYISGALVPFGLYGLRRRVAAWLAAASLPALILVYSFYWVGSWLLSPRYYFEALPGLAILSAGGVVWLGGWGRPATSVGSRVRRAIVSFVVLLLVVGNLGLYLPMRLGGLVGLYGITRAKLQAFDRVRPEQGLVVVHVARSWTEYGNLLPRTPPFCDCATLVVVSMGSGPDRRVAASFPDLPVFHYFTNEPGVLQPEQDRGIPFLTPDLETSAGPELRAGGGFLGRSGVEA
jgi:hypothetical protein